MPFRNLTIQLQPGLNLAEIRPSGADEESTRFSEVLIETKLQYMVLTGQIRSYEVEMSTRGLLSDLVEMGIISLHQISFSILGKNLKLTVFVPVDEEEVQFSGNFSGYSPLFMWYLVPNKVGWNELNQMGHEIVLSNNETGGTV